MDVKFTPARVDNAKYLFLDVAGYQMYVGVSDDLKHLQFGLRVPGHLTDNLCTFGLSCDNGSVYVQVVDTEGKSHIRTLYEPTKADEAANGA